MTTREREFIKPAVSQAQRLTADAILALHNGKAEEAKAMLGELWNALQEIENNVGVYTPMSLFE